MLPHGTEFLYDDWSIRTRPGNSVHVLAVAITEDERKIRLPDVLFRPASQNVLCLIARNRDRNQREAFVAIEVPATEPNIVGQIWFGSRNRK